MGTGIFPAHGWLPMGAHLELRGRCLSTGFGQIVQAPGNGQVIAVNQDAAFPGFGPAYPVVRIDSGPWAGRQYYLGHATAAMGVGERFSFAHPLGVADQVQDHAGTVGGWVELGEAWGGQPVAGREMPWLERLLRTPMVLRLPAPQPIFGDAGVHVRSLTAQLRDCGYLPRARWRFDGEVNAALDQFKRAHNLPAQPGMLDDRTVVVIAHAAEVCNRDQRKEV